MHRAVCTKMVSTFAAISCQSGPAQLCCSQVQLGLALQNGFAVRQALSAGPTFSHECPSAWSSRASGKAAGCTRPERPYHSMRGSTCTACHGPASALLSVKLKPASEAAGKRPACYGAPLQNGGG